MFSRFLLWKDCSGNYNLMVQSWASIYQYVFDYTIYFWSLQKSSCSLMSLLVTSRRLFLRRTLELKDEVVILMSMGKWSKRSSVLDLLDLRVLVAQIGNESAETPSFNFSPLLDHQYIFQAQSSIYASRDMWKLQVLFCCRLMMSLCCGAFEEQARFLLRITFRLIVGSFGTSSKIISCRFALEHDLNLMLITKVWDKFDRNHPKLKGINW